MNFRNALWIFWYTLVVSTKTSCLTVTPPSPDHSIDTIRRKKYSTVELSLTLRKIINTMLSKHGGLVAKTKMADLREKTFELRRIVAIFTSGNTASAKLVYDVMKFLIFFKKN